MLRLSKKVEYALIAMIYMSQKESGELTTARELSDKFEISFELVCKILQNLTRDGLVGSVQGVKGGYHPLRSAGNITINSIINAIEGPIKLTECAGDTNSPNCERTKICLIREPMKEIKSKLIHLFDEISLEDLQDKRT